MSLDLKFNLSAPAALDAAGLWVCVPSSCSDSIDFVS